MHELSARWQVIPCLQATYGFWDQVTRKYTSTISTDTYSLAVNGLIQTDAPSLTTSQTQTSEEVHVDLLKLSIDHKASNCTKDLDYENLLVFLPILVQQHFT